EFLFTDVEQAYGAADLALLSRHLVQSPVDQAFDADHRLLHVVMGDGSLGTLTLYRSEAITAWSAQSVEGAAFRAVAVAGGQVYLCLERNGKFYLGRFDEGCGLDLSITAELAEGEEPRRHWGGFDDLEGVTLAVWAD